MFKKKERLGRLEFAKYFKDGKKYHFPEFTIIVSPSPVRKVAVVVGKKISKLAVRRNVIRRKIYAALCRSFLIDPYQGIMIVIVKPAYKQVTQKVADAIVVKSIAQVIKNT